MGSFKIFSLIIIGAYIIAQLFSIVMQSRGPRSVTIYKRNYQDTNAYVRGYSVENTKVEVFDIKVKPKGFWDWLLLTQDDDNVLVDLFKAASALLFAWYFYQLNYDNIFSKRSLNLFWAGLFLCVLNYITLGVGADHTRDFFRAISAAKSADRSDYYDFQSHLRANTITHDYWIYVWVPMILVNFYKAFNRRHEGKPEEGWFGEDQTLEENRN